MYHNLIKVNQNLFISQMNISQGHLISLLTNIIILLFNLMLLNYHFLV
jgi:hypothetical protein